MISVTQTGRKIRRPILGIMILLIGLLAHNTVNAQNCFVNQRIKKITADISWAIKSYMEYKPFDFDTNPNKKYPLLIYIGGTGEMFQQPGGTDQDLCPALQYSMPWRMNVGHFPDVVTDPNTGQQFSYLVVMPFVTAWEQQYSIDPGLVIDYMLQHYPNRIDVSRIYLTGMSRGTDNLMGYATSTTAAANRLAAIVPVANCFPSYPGTAAYTQQVNNLASGNVHLWGISCANDEICTENFIQNFVGSLNAIRPGNALFTYSTEACEGPDSSFHYAWNHAYNPDYRAAPGNKNIYEWMIQFSKNTVLPVVLKDWTARFINGKVHLQWTTSQEMNTKEFAVQRASANGNFEDILTIPAAIASSTERKYSLVDERPLTGQNLYRLVLRNLDNKEEFFTIKTIDVPSRWTEQVIIPNPVRNGSISIYLNIEQSQRISIRLYDLYGRLIRQQDRQIPEGNSAHTMNVPNLQKGMYMVQVTGEDFKIVKKVSID
ncbi:MAG TPA: T9SS type A sorting domain-containing protein [Chitinophagaceae bacterium]